ncbi:C40 family peptidase [Rheinheimera salexigens]|uniref:Glycoside hydrolase n=1 Tax=Rheinheimera salexigens TaxID=1628148 RepID=A0A1E7Q432_9GAMM|nr:SH3 domain-containing protein [Rheinheimera salexigens]OEY68886.1 glycoside hydrolase [Rheinheimera salexigens]
MKILFFSLISCLTCSVLAANNGIDSGITFSSDVPLLQSEQLAPQYWQQKLAQGDQVILSPADIAARNAASFKRQAEMQPLVEINQALSAKQLTARINQVSSITSAQRYYADGSAVDAKAWQHYRQLLALDSVKPNNPVQFALVVKRTMLLAFPTHDRVFKQPDDVDLNRFQETGLFPAEPVAVLHQSRDKAWYLVQSFNYTGWVQASDIAIGQRQQVLDYAEQEPFLVVTGAKVHTAYTPSLPAISELQLDMGVRIPLLSAKDVGHNVNGQNPAASHIVQLPIRQADGRLDFTPALIARSQDVHQGYLAFTANNIISQAFKFLGERYGWGHDYNGRDCTGFVAEVYSSFGYKMPRNSSQQGKGEYGVNVRFNPLNDIEAKKQQLSQAQVGDLLYLPGHVAVYLGTSDGQDFIIHDVHGLAYDKTAAGHYQGILNGVFVTPLLPLKVSHSQTYLDVIYSIKSLR